MIRWPEVIGNPLIRQLARIARESPQGEREEPEETEVRCPATDTLLSLLSSVRLIEVATIRSDGFFPLYEVVCTVRSSVFSSAGYVESERLPLSALPLISPLF